ncbi:MAG: sigma-70 family RNA polymerase sigma factor [Clostridiales bacterium]|nr:sigma-70 family RNA polymerase sigma factor [Clostridiales bacterium]
MKKTTFTLHDINKDLVLRADSYLRTVIINKKRHYIRSITKFTRHGIAFLELEKFESNLAYNDSYFNTIGTTYFFVKRQHIPITIPEIAESLSELPEIHLQVLMQSAVLRVPIEEIAREFGVSKRTINVYKRNAIEELRKKLRNYEK